MSEGLAKSAAQSAPATVTAEPQKAASDAFSLSHENVPTNMYRFFNVDMINWSPKQITELQDIYQYARTKSKTKEPGEVLKLISDIERQLGSPAMGETRTGKIANYIRITRRIDDLNKEREAYKNGARR